jgi:cytochrome c553
LFHGYYADWAVVQPDVEISQIVVTAANAVATTTTPHGYGVNDSVIIRDAPGPKWRFNGKCVITAVTATTFTFAWGCGMSTGTPGVAPYTTANGTYLVPTSKDILTAPSPHMYAARSLIAKSAYAAYDPTSVNYGGNAANGQTVWQTRILKDPNSWIPNNQSLGVCADCHTKDGSDLKYFGFGQRQVLIAGLHRGLSESDAKDVAAFIASNPTPTPSKGRPWNPTYQPAPGLDSRPISEWAAGGGEEWTTVYDQDMREYSVPGGAPPNWTGGSYANWAQNATFNTREMPIYIPMPTWMTWLPKMNPKDFFHNALEVDFTTYPLWTTYQGYLSAFANVTLGGSIGTSDTTVTVNSGSSIANGDSIQIDSEYMQVVAGGGTTLLTVTRQQRGSTATSHSSGAFVSDFSTFVRQGYIEQPGNIQSFVLVYSPQLLPGGAGNLEAAGFAWPTQYGPAFYDVELWAISRKWEIMNRFWLQNTLDQTYISINGSPNARAAPMYKRGWYNQMVFNIGPHKAIAGQNLFRNRTAQNNANWSRETARWYHAAAVIDPGDRFAQGNLELDWPYYYAFNASLGLNRPALYMQLFPHAFEIQNTWGWPALRQNGASAAAMTLHPLRLNFPFTLRYVDLFASEAEEGELVSQVASQTAAAVDGTIFSTANWQDYFLNVDGCPLAHTPNALSAYLGSICYSDSVALGLAIMNHYGVASATKNLIVNWANAVWAASGHNFSMDAAATCSRQGEIPQTLQCSNF